jgi:hypothetical protein
MSEPFLDSEFSEYNDRRIADLEYELRMEWAFNHGCKPIAIYGDDGELQCSECFTDFKRLPLCDLRKHVGLARLQAAQHSMPGATVHPRVRGYGPFDPLITGRKEEKV